MLAFAGHPSTTLAQLRPQLAVRKVFRPSVLQSVASTRTAAAAAVNSYSWGKWGPRDGSVAAAAGKQGGTLDAWPPSPAHPGALCPIPGSFQLSETGQLFVTHPEAWDPEISEQFEDKSLAERRAYKAGSEAPQPLHQLLENLHKQLEFTLGDTDGWPYEEAPYEPSGLVDPEHTLIIGAAPGTWTAAATLRGPAAKAQANKVASLVLTHASISATEKLDDTLLWALSGTVCNKEASVQVVDASALLDNGGDSPANTGSWDAVDEDEEEKHSEALYYSRTPDEVLEAASLVSKVGPVSIYRQGLILSTEANFPFTYCPVCCE